jgi:C1A family cysteine protease
LSISDAIGLITLRLGRVEQWVIDTEQENESNPNDGSNSGLPENSRIIDNSVLSSIINRLETVEKMGSSSSSEDVSELSSSVSKLTEQLTKMGDDVIKHTMEISKHNEQMFRYNRELTETKDILKTFMIRYDGFVKETNDKFSDYEVALADLEKNVHVQAETSDNGLEGTSINDINSDNGSSADNIIMSVDLKNIIKQELASA